MFESAWHVIGSAEVMPKAARHTLYFFAAEEVDATSRVLATPPPHTLLSSKIPFISVGSSRLPHTRQSKPHFATRLQFAAIARVRRAKSLALTPQSKHLPAICRKQQPPTTHTTREITDRLSE